MLNYGKRLVVIVYRINIEGLVEFNTEASTAFQVRPVAQTPVVATVLALLYLIVVVRHFLCS